ncbi:MAG: hypothetical protein ACP5RC_03655 [Halothiobacillaceae bacterium]
MGFFNIFAGIFEAKTSKTDDDFSRDFKATQQRIKQLDMAAELKRLESEAENSAPAKKANTRQ